MITYQFKNMTNIFIMQRKIKRRQSDKNIRVYQKLRRYRNLWWWEEMRSK